MHKPRRYVIIAYVFQIGSASPRCGSVRVNGASSFYGSCAPEDVGGPTATPPTLQGRSATAIFDSAVNGSNATEPDRRTGTRNPSKNHARGSWGSFVLTFWRRTCEGVCSESGGMNASKSAARDVLVDSGCDRRILMSLFIGSLA